MPTDDLCRWADHRELPVDVDACLRFASEILIGAIIHGQ
jgi:hypothetical protein